MNFPENKKQLFSVIFLLVVILAFAFCFFFFINSDKKNNQESELLNKEKIETALMNRKEENIKYEYKVISDVEKIDTSFSKKEKSFKREKDSIFSCFKTGYITAVQCNYLNDSIVRVYSDELSIYCISRFNLLKIIDSIREGRKEIDRLIKENKTPPN